VTLRSRSDTVPLEDGRLRFYDAWRSSLEAGEYRISLRQQVRFVGQEHEFPADQRMVVEGPRFRIDPNDVESMWPPPFSQGPFDRTLPTIVLRDRSLPWVRVLRNSAGPDKPAVPWMAVLLFDRDELPAPQDGQDDTTRARTITVRDLLERTPADTFFPPLQPEVGDDLDASCRVIDVPLDTFRAVAPALDELAFLSHACQVDPLPKPYAGSEPRTRAREETGEGEFQAVVAANRLIAAEGEQIAHLVSLEGYEEHLRGGPAPIDKPHVRLVSLAGWSFGARDRGTGFAELMERLDSGLLRLPDPTPDDAAAAEPGGDPAEIVRRAREQGYVPLVYSMRQGEGTVAWYRGPLSPVSRPRVERERLTSADAALIYDPETGMFDVSYGVAWQIGRLLALSDRAFAMSLLAWRRKGHRTLALVRDRLRLLRRLGLPAPRSLSDLLDGGFGRRLAGAVLGSGLVPSGGRDAPVRTGRDPAGLADRPQLPGVVSRDEILAILEAGEDPHVALRDLVRGEEVEA
jgi:hypothetical protein